MSNQVKLQIAKSPCIPMYGIVVGDDELWDCDCASDSQKETLEIAAEQYPGVEVILFGDPRHYSQRV